MAVPRGADEQVEEEGFFKGNGGVVECARSRGNTAAGAGSAGPEAEAHNEAKA
jgi:hypothetical protein